jgi:endonuclease/exonuclease/phosphatase family metal-dependent hydrolase
MKRLIHITALFLFVPGCGTVPPTRHLACGGAMSPVSRSVSPNSATISVLTYNIEGLGWPARSGRAPSLAKIADHLAAARASRTAPDIVMVQEMFSGAAKKAVLGTGYPAIVSGPARTAKADDPVSGKLPGRASVKRGETGFHLTGSGLAIASIYPFSLSRSQPYGRRSCAGIDCLSNKGIMLARIVIPGVPVPIDLYNTHMNSRGASKAPHARNLAAHERQSLEASRFVDRTHDDSLPMIFGGDFNMRRAQDRWDNFTRYQSMNLVHRVCMDRSSQCDVRMSWDGDEPWVDTQDLQFFESGNEVSIRPIRVEAMFDGSPSSPALSDHDGFLVTYRISWPGGTPRRTGC